MAFSRKVDTNLTEQLFDLFKSELKIRQKDTDARWTKKNNQSYYGYKNHVKCDQKNKLIENYIVTHAAVHDSQTVEDLLEDSDVGKELYADSAY